MTAPILDYIEYEDLVRTDANGLENQILVRVFYTAENFVPYSPATWLQPEEGGFFEDVWFHHAEIDPLMASAAPLDDVELAAALAWFALPATQDVIQERLLERVYSRERC